MSLLLLKKLVPLIAGLVVVVGLFYAGWRANGWRVEAGQRDDAIAERDAAVRAAEAFRQRTADEINRVNAISKGYRDEIDSLRNRPVPVVRVCNPPVPATKGESPTGPGAGEAAPGTGALPPQAGPDIGPGLAELADEADQMLARLRALQEYVRGLE